LPRAAAPLSRRQHGKLERCPRRRASLARQSDAVQHVKRALPEADGRSLARQSDAVQHVKRALPEADGRPWPGDPMRFSASSQRWHMSSRLGKDDDDWPEVAPG
jgi:hypothetical protein